MADIVMDQSGITALGGVAPKRRIVDQGDGTHAERVAASLPNADPFIPIRGATISLTVGPTATTAPVALPANTATAYRIRNAASSASPVTWTISSSNMTVPVIPTPYSTSGTGGTAGDKTIDPGGVEVFRLTAAQQTALAAGTLYLSAICPSGGSAVISVTPGTGA